MSKFLTKEEQEAKLKAIFQQFDTDNSGFITKENIVFAMQKLGRKLNEEELDDIMREHDANGDGKLVFDEFVQVFWDE